MITKSATPGMKDREEAWKICADVFGVKGKLFDGLRGGFEHGRIPCSLMGADECAKLFGDGKGNHEVVSGETLIDSCLQPLSCFMVLAGRTVSIAAGLVDDMRFTALLTHIMSDAGIFCTAINKRLDDFLVYRRHGGGKTVYILRAKGAKDLIYRRHGQTLAWCGQ